MELQNKTYKELQALAKAAGIKATSKKDVLIAALEALEHETEAPQ